MPGIRPRRRRQQRCGCTTRSRLRKSRSNTTRSSNEENYCSRRDGSDGPDICAKRRDPQTLGQCPPSKEGRRDMVQGRTPRGDRKNRTQTNLQTGPSRRTGIRTPRNQQNVPVGKPQVLVAKHATRRKRLRERMCGMPKKQNQYATYQG